jgi:triacylglycerol lipase
MNIDVYRSTLCKLSYFNNRKDSIFISDNQTDCQCYIDYNNKGVFITFRGTSSIDDWKHDADTRTENPKDNIRIHKGFFNQYMSVKPKIYKIIKQINKNINIENIHISGHSLGGALAYVCAVDIHLATKNPNIRVLTIGSPRPGNKDFDNITKFNT